MRGAHPPRLRERLVPRGIATHMGGPLVAALGMTSYTLARWVGAKRPSVGFERVEVVAASAPRAVRQLVVHGPRGLRIEGLDMTAVAELVRQVGE